MTPIPHPAPPWEDMSKAINYISSVFASEYITVWVAKKTNFLLLCIL